MGKYDISSILLAIGERKAQERARNQALDLEREKMMSDRQYQSERLELEKEQVGEQIETSKKQRAFAEKQIAALDWDQKMKEEGNPEVNPEDFAEEAARFNANLKPLYGKKVRLTTVRGIINYASEVGLKYENLALLRMQRETSQQAGVKEKYQGLVAEEQYKKLKQLEKIEEHTWRYANPIVYDHDADGKPIGTGRSVSNLQVDFKKLDELQPSTWADISRGMNIRGEDRLPTIYNAAKTQTKKIVEPYFTAAEGVQKLADEAMSMRLGVPGSYEQLIPELYETALALKDKESILDSQSQKRLDAIIQSVLKVQSRVDAETRKQIEMITLQAQAKSAGRGMTSGKDK